MLWRGAENFQPQLSKFPIAPSLGPFIPVAARHVEKQRFASSVQQQFAALLKQRSCLWDQAAGAPGLVIEGPHLADDFAAAGFFDKRVLTP